MDVITLSNVSKTFQTGSFPFRDSFVAVNDISFSVPKGKTLGIVGESGSGKSTVLKMILGLTNVTSGVIHLEGEDVTNRKYASRKRVATSIQPIFQNPASSFNPRQSIRNILRAPLEVHTSLPKADIDVSVDRILEEVGLNKGFAQRYPHQLSGGQKQRVAIARALILEPRIILADEPTSALDVSVQSQILELLDEVKSARALTMIFVSHNLAVVKRVSDMVAVMRRGHLVESGITDEIFNHPATSYTRELIDAVPDTRRKFWVGNKQ